MSKQPDENTNLIDNFKENETELLTSNSAETLPQLTSTPEIEPTPTPTPTPMPKSLNLPDDLNVSGTIWLMDVGDEFTNIVKLDLTNHTVEINPYQLFCMGIVTRRADAICQESPEREFLIVNLETGLSSIFSEVDHSMIAAYIDNHFFVGLTSNSTGITYRFSDLDSDAEYFFLLDHDSNIAGAPRISPDGEFIINTKSFGSGDYRLMLYDPIKETNTQISAENQYISNQFSWSPVNTHLVYGTADFRSEIGNPANQYYLFSLESWESKLFFHSTTAELYNIHFDHWSPNGEFVAIKSTDNKFCVLGINEKFEQCYDVLPNSISWSPDSTRLALYYNEGETPWIGILEVETGIVHSILESPDFGRSVYLNWVKD